jgi:hypothetical protein
MVPLSGNQIQASTENHQVTVLSNDMPSNAALLQDYNDGLHIRVSNSSAYQDGLNLFSLSIFPNASLNTRMINSTTVMYAEKDTKNISFWNIVTNKTVITDIPAGHHEFDYNPLTKQFVSFSAWIEDYYNVAENKTYPVKYDDVVCYNWDGSVAWTWSCNETFPFNYTEFSLRNEVNRGQYDWTHTNALMWDAEEGTVYVSVRHLDCIVEINGTTGTSDWVVGRYTGNAPRFTLYNQNGDVVNAIFYHAHALEKTGPDQFILFDNDYYNLTRANPLVGRTMLLRFEVNETARTAHVIWSWKTPPDYFQFAQGNADLMPNGDVVGAFNDVPTPWLTEVTPDGTIDWEFMFNITQSNAGFRIEANAFERFVEQPIVKNVVYSQQITEGENATLSMNVWDTFKRRYDSDAVVKVMEGDTDVTTHDFTLLQYWQETPVSTVISGLAVGTHNLTIQVVNIDGSMTQLSISVVVNANILPYVGVAAAGIIVVAVVVYLWKRK